jgi:hypothetical protein
MTVDALTRQLVKLARSRGKRRVELRAEVGAIDTVNSISRTEDHVEVVGLCSLKAAAQILARAFMTSPAAVNST